MKRQSKTLKFSSHSAPKITSILSFHTLDWFLLFWDFALMGSHAVIGVNMISVGFMCIRLSGWSCFFHFHYHVAFHYVDKPQFILSTLMDILLVYGLRLLWIMTLWALGHASCGEYVRTFLLILRVGFSVLLLLLLQHLTKYPKERRFLEGCN